MFQLPLPVTFLPSLGVLKKLETFIDYKNISHDERSVEKHALNLRRSPIS